MNTITIFFSLTALWSLLSFNRKGKKLKINYGLIAYALVLLFGIQSICLILLGCQSSFMQALLTICLSLPVTSSEGNVSQSINDLRGVYEKITIRIRKKHW